MDIPIPKACIIKDKTLTEQYKRAAFFRQEIISKIYEMIEGEELNFSIIIPENINVDQIVEELKLEGYQVEFIEEKSLSISV